MLYVLHVHVVHSYMDSLSKHVATGYRALITILCTSDVIGKELMLKMDKNWIHIHHTQIIN